MIKKLSLFTLLVSSFLVISCSSPTEATKGIDSKYNGIYKGTIGGLINGVAIGSAATKEFTSQDWGEGGFAAKDGFNYNCGAAIDIMITKKSDTRYEAYNNVYNENYVLEFSDGGKTLTYTYPEGTWILTKQ